ncbi:hypothetical protein GCM10027073_37720 [Streptomyces chlorus]
MPARCCRPRRGPTIHYADRDAENPHEPAARIAAAGDGRHRPHPPRGRHRPRPGRPDLLAAVAVAGIMRSSPVLETRDEDLYRVLDVNFKECCTPAGRRPT